MGRKRNTNKKADEIGFSVRSEYFICDKSPVYGRYLKAKTDIPSGSIILKEKCIVAGPKSSSKQICVGCHADASKYFAKFKCSKCQWPLCTNRCENSPFHTLECKIFSERKIPPPADGDSGDYGALGALRAVLLKLYRPQEWQKFITLQHHNDERKSLPTWKTDEKTVEIIRNKWNLGDLFSDEEILSACGIFEVNGFEMGDFNSFGGIFPTSAMIAHECVPNAGYFANMEELVLEIITLVDIPAGSAITMCYDCCLKGTSVRKNCLKRSKYFECSCSRCQDPLELGTNFSTLYCLNSACKRGVLTKTADGEWKCNKCSLRKTDEDIMNLLQPYEDKTSKSLEGVKEKEEFLLQCKSLFHPNHFIPFGVKFSLCMAYGHDEGYMLGELSSADAYRKLEICQEVLKILDVLTPGMTTARGNILYELQAAEVIISRNLIESGKCSKALVKRKLQNALKILQEAIAIFELSYPLRYLAESAKKSTLKELYEFLAALK